MYKIALTVCAGILLAGCQVDTIKYHYDPREIKPAKQITREHVDPNAFRPLPSSPVCYKMNVYHPGKTKPQVDYRCFN